MSTEEPRPPTWWHQLVPPKTPPPPTDTEVELAKLREEVRQLRTQQQPNMRTRRRPSMAVPVFGLIFAVLGIFTVGAVFLPLAALCVIGGMVGGCLDGSPTKVIISVMVGVLVVFGFVISPSAQLAALALFLAH